MATDVDDSMMEGSPEFKQALKMVLKRQMKDLINQICEQGIEIAVMEVNINDGSTSHFGTPIGESFIAEQKSLTHNFASFCKMNGRSTVDANVPSDRSPRRRIEKKNTATSKSRPSTSADPPTLRITVPRRLSVGISEQELGGLVGRIVASQLDKNKEKGDGSSGGTKFDALLESIKAKEKTHTPNVTRSGRKVSNKFLEGLKSSKKSIKAEESESGDEGNSEKLIGQLSDLEMQAMKKVQVKTGDGKSVDVQKTTLVQGDQLESLAASIIKELQRVPNIADRKQVKVAIEMLADDGTIEEVHEFEFVANDRNNAKGPRMVLTFADRNHANSVDESMDDEETEYLDHVRIMPDDGEEPDVNIVDNPEIDPPVVAMKKMKRKIKLEVMCSLCNLMLRNKRSLKLHFKSVHSKIRVKSRCEVCYRRFKSPQLLTSHILNVHTEQCQNCSENVTEKERWVKGKRVHDTVDCSCGAVVAISKTPYKDKGSFSCMECGVLFRSVWQLQRHQAHHTNEESVKCYLCQSNFKNKRTLMKHLSTLHKVFVNRCKYCGKNYGNEMALNVHMSKVHCNDAVAPFSVETDAEEENVMKLSQAAWDNLTGSEPKRKTEDKSSDSDSIGPMGTVHKKIKWKDNREQTCEQCGQVIKGKQALQAHIRRVHLKEKNHHCKVCSKGFYANSIVENHMLTVHTRICDQCKESVVETEPFTENMTVRTLRKVTCKCGHVVNIMSKVGGKLLPEAPQDEKGDNLYQCATCGHLFSTRSECEKHQRGHDLVCRLCAKTFTMKSSLARHMEKIHNMQTQPCQFCQKNFSSEYSLTLHLRKTHNYHGVVDTVNGSQIHVVQDLVVGPENAELTDDLTGMSYSSVDLNS